MPILAQVTPIGGAQSYELLVHEKLPLEYARFLYRLTTSVSISLFSIYFRQTIFINLLPYTLDRIIGATQTDQGHAHLLKLPCLESGSWTVRLSVTSRSPAPIGARPITRQPNA